MLPDQQARLEEWLPAATDLLRLSSREFGPTRPSRWPSSTGTATTPGPPTPPHGTGCGCARASLAAALADL